MNIDSYGTIVQDPPSNNGGDSCNRAFQYCTLFFVIITKVLKEYWRPKITFDAALRVHQIRNGVFCRHPGQNAFTKNPLNMTKDQMTFVLVALGLWKECGKAWSQLFQHIVRLGFYPNFQRDYPGSWKFPWKHKALNQETGKIETFGPDFADWSWPQDWGVFFRATRFPLFWPLLLITDLFLWGASIVHCRIYAKDPDNVDDMQLLGIFLQSMLIMPTPFSKAAIQFYFKNRPTNLGNIPHKNPGGEEQYLLPYEEREDGVMASIAWYFRPQWVQYPGKGTNYESPDFVYMWRPVIQWMRGALK